MEKNEEIVRNQASRYTHAPIASNMNSAGLTLGGQCAPPRARYSRRTCESDPISPKYTVSPPRSKSNRRSKLSKSRDEG